MRVLTVAILGVVLAIALTPVAAVSGPFEDGLDAHNSGDYTAAHQLLYPLAEQGHAGAQSIVDNMHSSFHMERDLWWWRMAAERGDPRGQFNFGLFQYLPFVADGPEPTAEDYVQGYMWISLAASRFPPGKDRDRAVRFRDNAVAVYMTPVQIAEAQKLAREWKPVGERAE